MVLDEVAKMREPATLPRRNGELVFDAPWQGRAFGMAVALCAAQRYRWEDFRERLVASIAAAPQPGEDYYERWLSALEQLLSDVGLVAGDELAAQQEAVARRADLSNVQHRGDAG